MCTRQIFHITHIENLAGILQHDGLYCKNWIEQNILSPVSIAYEGIQDRRHDFQVPVNPFGVLHDYIPFSFAPRTPMLYTIRKGNVPNYQGGQTQLIYLISDTNLIINEGLQFVFTNGHPIVFLSEFFNNISLLSTEIDWEVIQARYWRDTPSDPDRKRRRQAEFLVLRKLPFNLITEIAVYEESMLRRVNDMISESNRQTLVQIRSNWYY